MVRAFLRDTLDRRRATEHNVYIGRHGEVTASSGVKVVGVVRPPAASSRTKTRDDRGPAIKTEVARFQGTAYIAERIDDELVIYLVTQDPVATQTTGDDESGGTGWSQTGGVSGNPGGKASWAREGGATGASYDPQLGGLGLTWQAKSEGERQDIPTTWQPGRDERGR